MADRFSHRVLPRNYTGPDLALCELLALALQRLPPIPASIKITDAPAMPGAHSCRLRVGRHSEADHWHGLLELGDVESLSRNVGRAKFGATRALRIEGFAGQAWTQGFHERAMRREEDLIAAGRYVVANPLRAGLVERVADYPFWSAVWLDGSTPV